MKEKSAIIAFGTDDGVRVKCDDHCGKSKFYSVYEFKDGAFQFLEKRKNVMYHEDESIKGGDPEKAKAVSSVLQDVEIMVCGRFGPNITRIMKKYVCVIVRVEKIEDAMVLLQKNFDRIIIQLQEKERKRPVIFNERILA